jgi:heat shock protein HtpX
VYDQVTANKRRSVLLIAGFVLFVALVAFVVQYLLGFGIAGLVIALIIAGGSAFGSYWKSDTIALAMSRARPASQEEFPRLHNLVEGICIGAGLPKPRIFVIEDAAPNAFATGRDPEHGAIAVTTGLLNMMNRVELEGVVAHELSHIKNYDTLVNTLAVTMVGVVALLADFSIRFMWWGGGRSNRDDRRDDGGLGVIIAIFGFILLLSAPLIGKLMQMAVSRRRESLADMSAVEITRYPPGLISALEKLRDDHTVTHSASRATAHMWIESPLALDESEGKLSRFNKMFDTHPPIEERIAALREL